MPHRPGVLLAVPNISTGRDEVEAASIASNPRLLDLHCDPDHNRTVATYAGPPRAVVDSCDELVIRAVEQLDLRSHRGVHPRFGVVDVLPLVPYGAGEAEATHAARDLTARIESAGVPVLAYGRAASPEISLVELRRRLARGHEALHPTAGVVCLGVRDPLVAFNVNLSGSHGRAKAVARRVRGPRLRSLAFELGSRSLVQLSMNLVHPFELGPLEAFEAVAAGARAEGLAVVDCEVVGLLPAPLLDQVSELPLIRPPRSIESALRQLQAGGEE